MDEERIVTPDPEHLLNLASWCAGVPGFVSNWGRLTGRRMAMSPLDRMIDEATGKDKEDAWAFVAFVQETVWERLPRDCFEPLTRIKEPSAAVPGSFGP